jgi:photosystem II stability/assembly factor-like uncharacterized protein
MGTRLYAGTENGMVVLRSTTRGWEEVNRGIAHGTAWSMDGPRDRPEEVCVAVHGDGLYRTQDAGLHWEKLLDVDAFSVRVDPTDADVIYVGTEPVGLYRSEDRGRSWQRLPGIDRVPAGVKAKWWGPLEPHQGHVLDIFIHPDDPGTCYLALEHGGVLRSFNRGESWEDVSAGIDYVDMHVIAAAPPEHRRYFVSSARGFFASDDPGEGWVRAENGFTRDYFHHFLFLPPRRLPPRRAGTSFCMLASSADGSPGYWDRPEHARAAVFRSDDDAQSWQRVGVGGGLPDVMENGIWTMVGCAGEPDMAFIGLGRTRPKHLPGGIRLTRDRGDTWEPIPIALEGVRGLWAAPD